MVVGPIRRKPKYSALASSDPDGPSGSKLKHRVSIAKQLRDAGITAEYYVMAGITIISIIILYLSIGFGTGLINFVKESPVVSAFTTNVEPRREEFNIPPIVHFVWTNQQRAGFNFRHALSIMSASQQIEPDIIYLWLTREPKGMWWNLVQKRVSSLVVKYLPTSARKDGFKVNEHSEVIKLDKLIEYGGIYVNFDVIVLQPLQPLLNHRVVLGHREKDEISDAIILAEKGSPFLRQWRKRYDKHIKPADISSKRPTFLAKLARSMPRHVYVQPTSILRPYWSEMNLLNTDWDSNPYFALKMWTMERDLNLMLPADMDCMDNALGKVLRKVYYGKKKPNPCNEQYQSH